MKKVVTIELSKELSLEVEGIYYPGEPMVWTLPNGDPGHPGSPSEFEIEDIRIFKGNIINYTQYIDDYLWNKLKNQNISVIYDIWEHLSDLCIKQIENE